MWKDLLTKYGNDEINYDAIGNPLNIGNNWSFTWDNGRSLASTTKSGITSSYKYNDSGIRTSKTVGTVTTNYYLNGDSVVRETTGTDILDYFYDEKGDLFAFNYNGVGYFYVRNGQNDIIGILDASGTLVVSYVYDSWGKLIGTTGSDASTIGLKNPYRYRGYRYDNETELYYLQSRYYNPETCRMLNADGYVTTGQGLNACNMFAYCGNNPVNNMDPTGHSWLSIAVACFAVAAICLIAVVAAPVLAVAAAGAGIVLAASSIATVATAIGITACAVGISMTLTQSRPITLALPKVKVKEKTKDIALPPKDTVIYRYGYSKEGIDKLVPTAADVATTTGLSFSTIPRTGAAITTINTLNATGVLRAVQDGVTHVSVYPVGGTVADWHNAGSNSIWTKTLNTLCIKWDGGN